MANIIIVDDDPDVRQLFVSIIQTANHELREAGSGLQALALINQQRPDLVLIDQNMPGMSGLELARHIRADKVPFIFISNDTGWELVKTAIDLGAQSYLAKGFEPEQLLLNINIALAKEDKQQHPQENSISTATGIIAGRSHRSVAEAYTFLQSIAQNKNISLESAAKQLIQHIEETSSFLGMGEDR